MLTTLAATIGSLDKLFGVFKNNEDNLRVSDMLEKDKRGVLQANGNIVSLISDLIIEPKILITDELYKNEKITDVINVNLDIFVSIYAQAFMVLNQIHGLNGQTSISLLSNKFNASYGTEKLSTNLLDMGVNKFLVVDEGGTEGKKKDNESDDESNSKLDYEFKSKMFQDMVRTVTINMMYKNSAGEPIRVNIPIIIKPVISYIPTSDVFALIKTNGDTSSVSSAWHAWRSGEKSLSDVLFGSSLVDDYKSARLKDKNSTLLDTENRKRAALTKLASDGAIGLGKLYQMIITSAQTKADINTLIRGKLDKDRYKDKFLDQTSSLALTVMDDDWEMVTVYLNSLSGSFDSPYTKLSKDKDAGFKDLLDLITMQKGI